MVVDSELEAMSKIGDALNGLDEKTTMRIVRWIVDKYGVASSGMETRTSAPALLGGEVSVQGFADIAELFFSASPSTEAERVLVSCYWLQVLNKAESLDAQQVNSQLKHMGQGASNITRAFNDLINRKPSFVMQVHKNGAGKQARKKYKLTTAGVHRVDDMLKANS